MHIFNELLCFLIKTEKTSEEVHEFLKHHKSSHVKYCNVVDIRFDLVDKKVINDGKRQQIENAKSKSDAADLFYQFLYNDPAEETLQDAAAVLRDAEATTKTNQKFAKVIEDFLAQ